MLWADGGDTGGYWAGAAGLIMAAGSAIVTVYVALRRGISEKRKEALDEWKEIASEQQDEIDALRKELKDSQLEHSKEMRETQAAEMRCQIKVTQLEGELRLMESTVRRLQRLAGDEPPATMTPGLVIADVNGIIQVVSPALIPILHYRPEELKGKSVEVLMPERYKAAHRAALAKAGKSVTGPWPEKVILGDALTKEGEEVPVAINLSGWQTANGDWQICAEVRQRKVSSSLGDPK